MYPFKPLFSISILFFFFSCNGQTGKTNNLAGPQYKKQLEEYSVINGTGISAILDHMADPRISPNGKYLSVTIFGYPHQAFEKNCVAIW